MTGVYFVSTNNQKVGRVIVENPPCHFLVCWGCLGEYVLLAGVTRVHQAQAGVSITIWVFSGIQVMIWLKGCWKTPVFWFQPQMAIRVECLERSLQSLVYSLSFCSDLRGVRLKYFLDILQTTGRDWLVWSCQVTNSERRDWFLAEGRMMSSLYYWLTWLGVKRNSGGV